MRPSYRAIAAILFTFRHAKYFRLDRHHSQSCKPSCIIVQGCPLSMLILTCLATAWLDYSEVNIPFAVSRVYADDISSVLKGNSSIAVKQGLQDVYQSTPQFTSVAGLHINTKKTFTFGNSKLKAVSATGITNPPSGWSVVVYKNLLHPWGPCGSNSACLFASYAKFAVMLGYEFAFCKVSKNVMRSMRATVVRTMFNTYIHKKWFCCCQSAATHRMLTSGGCFPMLSFCISIMVNHCGQWWTAIRGSCFTAIELFHSITANWTQLVGNGLSFLTKHTSSSPLINKDLPSCILTEFH